MRHWFTRGDMKLAQTSVKRFEASHWTVDFPRGAMASAISRPGENTLDVFATFARRGDLVGLIFESKDRHVHIGHRREHSRDYSNCRLSFRWISTGLKPLDAADGATLTIEGRDKAGEPKTWYVRLWNYAAGTPTDALVTLDFNRLDGGFVLPQDAQRVFPGAIDRMFISLVPPGFEAGSAQRLDQPIEASVTLSDMKCSGSGSVLALNDAFVPEHGYRICTAYDDCYHLTPERVVDEIERLGYRQIINHYVGMSHYPALRSDGLVEEAGRICEPARRWHESYARLVAERGWSIIWSVSMELLEPLCPEDWRQRSWDGLPARTGYTPPSSLLSPAVAPAVAFLGKIAADFTAIGVAAGLPAKVQVGEPWWWVTTDNKICLYDDAAKQLWPIDHQPIRDIRAADTADAIEVLEHAGRILSEATASIVREVEAAVGPVRSHILPYLPSVIRDDAPDLARANLPVGWAYPAYDVLQLEDYDWVIEGQTRQRQQRLQAIGRRLGYEPGRRHYLAGFALSAARRSDWDLILAAAKAEKNTGCSEVFLWALPQVLRDGLTIFEGDEDVQSFRDVNFPLEVSCAAWVEPQFSTSISASAKGFEARNIAWEQALLQFDAGAGIRSLEDLQTLLQFFRSVRGSAIAFRFRDPMDFSSAGMTSPPSPDDMLIGIGDGIRRRFPLVKRYGEGEVRRITRPVAESVLVSVDGRPTTDWLLGEKGEVEFRQPPRGGASIRAGFLFDVPVRFADDRLKVSRQTFLAGEVPSILLREVKEA